MTRFIVVVLVLVLASYSIEHKVLKVPLAMHYDDNMQVVGNTENLRSDLDNLMIKEVDEEFEIDTEPSVNKVYLIVMWYPETRFVQDQRFMLDLNSSLMTAPIRSCYGCIGNVTKLPEQFHD